MCRAGPPPVAPLLWSRPSASHAPPGSRAAKRDARRVIRRRAPEARPPRGPAPRMAARTPTPSPLPPLPAAPASASLPEDRRAASGSRCARASARRTRGTDSWTLSQPRAASAPFRSAACVRHRGGCRPGARTARGGPAVRASGCGRMRPYDREAAGRCATILVPPAAPVPKRVEVGARAVPVWRHTKGRHVEDDLVFLGRPGHHVGVFSTWHPSAAVAVRLPFPARRQ